MSDDDYKHKRILVIRLSALGDLILCMKAFSSIRKAHKDAEIALLTSPAFASFAMQMPWFDHVIIDNRPKVYEIRKWWKLIKEVRNYAPTRVYDLQGKTRQTILYYVLHGYMGLIEWSGAIKKCSHPRLWPPKPNMHYTDFLSAQLENANVKIDDDLDLSWLSEKITNIELPKKYAVIIPGCAPQHLHKRWGAKNYAELSKILYSKGITVLAVGTKDDADAVSDIRKIDPNLIDFTGKTTLKQLASLFRGAEFVIGNDTGPTHLSAIVGAHTIALMSDKVDPYWSSPKGKHTTWLQGRPLKKLSVSKVTKALGLGN